MSILSQQVEKLVQDVMKQGGYSSPDDVVLAGLAYLREQGGDGGFEAGEMEKLLEEGERSGPSLDGEEVLAELRSLREQARSRAE